VVSRDSAQGPLGRGAAVVLAGGRSSRMKPGTDKMTAICAGKPVITWVVDRLADIELLRTVMVISSAKNTMSLRQVLSYSNTCDVVEQTQFYGSALAVLAARDALRDFAGPLVVVDGDMVLLRRRTVQTLVRVHLENGPLLTALGFFPSGEAQSTGYERVPCRLRPHSSQGGRRSLSLVSAEPCLAGAMCLQWPAVLPELERFAAENRKEHRLSVLPARLVARGFGQEPVKMVFLDDATEARSVNTSTGLQKCEALLQSTTQGWE
jgi:bifunctional UDP-N-acetylglucosamine pyrophosphorylase/glucosamine-1-phosphate N-acetyltransferase